MTFVFSGCSINDETVAKNKEIIELVSGDSTRVYTNIFKDTETGQEYIVFTYKKVLQ